MRERLPATLALGLQASDLGMALHPKGPQLQLPAAPKCGQQHDLEIDQNPENEGLED
jgi:hypothetical protein